MPLNPYYRPQQTITQNLRQTPGPAATRRNPIVIGPEFKLMLNDGREVAEYAFASLGDTQSYEVTNGNALDLSRWTPQTSTAELNGKDLQALVANFSSGLFTIDDSPENTSLRDIRLGTDLVAGVGSLNASLDGRAVRVGDIVNVASTADGNNSTNRRKVVELLGKVTPSPDPAGLSILQDPNVVEQANPASGTVTDALNLTGTVSVADFQMSGNTLFPNPSFVNHNSGKKALGDVMTVEVIVAGAPGVAELRISSAVTGQSSDIVTADDAGDYEIDLTSLGSGVLVLSYSGASLPLGATFTVSAYPIYGLVIADSGAVTLDSELYTGDVDVTYAIEVVENQGDANAKTIQVYDTAGNEPVLTYDVSSGGNDLALGSFGVVMSSFALGDHYVGRKLFVTIPARKVSTSSFTGLRLDGPAINAADYNNAGAATLTSVEVLQTYSGSLGPENGFDGSTDPVSYTANDFSYAGGMSLPNEVTGRSGIDQSPFADGYGSVTLSYKAVRIPTELEEPLQLTSLTAIKETVGETNQENWLGRGCAEAFNGNQSRTIYALRTGGDTIADFTKALKSIRTTDQVYALAVLSDDPEVQKLVAEHCETLSNPQNKNFRRCYVGTDSPGSYIHWGELPGGGYRQATLSAKIVTIEEDDREVSVFTADDIGSSIEILSLGGSYEITDILSPYECQLDIDVNLSVTTPAGVTLTRPDTPEATALFVAGRSEALNSRRAVNVWADRPTVVNSSTGLSEVLPNKFLACEVAGLRCALLPQQGLTMTEIEAVTAIPGAYTRFTPELLDDVAAAGTMVVTQETTGGEIFIRHQLTTDIDSGALAYEDNVGVIVDEFAYAEKDRFRKYIGRRNVTPDTIETIRIELKALATEFTQYDLINQEIGAAVITFFDEEGTEGEVTVRVDGDLADTLLTYVLLRVPLPLNGINHYIDVETSVEL